MRRKACKRNPGNEAAILNTNTVFTVTNCLDLVTSPDKISEFSFHTIPDPAIAYSKISTLESRFVCRIHQIRVDGSRIGKGKVEDS